MNLSFIRLTNIFGLYVRFTSGSKKNQIALLHKTFRSDPEFKELCTEALLTFDTEAGGQTMNLEAADVEKEEQP